MGDGFAGTALGYSFEHLAYLEEKHHEHSLGELGLGAGQEPYDQGTDGGYAHKEILIQGLTVDKGFSGLFECIPTDYQIRNQVHQEVLPCGPGSVVFDNHGNDQKDGRGGNLDYSLLGAFFMMMVMMPFLMLVVMVMMVLMLMFVFMMMLMMVLVLMAMALMRVSVDMFVFFV